jgi:hypothetical protein
MTAYVLNRHQARWNMSLFPLEGNPLHIDTN